MQERRVLVGEVRAGASLRVTGIAARYNNPTMIGSGSRKAFKEILMPGAFRKAVTEKHDAAFLINHDHNRLMGRVSSGTLRLHETAQGLEFECDFPNSECGRDAYASIQRGDMHGCSFGFTMKDSGDDDWSLEKDGRVAVRRIRSIHQLQDVSAVTFPAYPNTSVSARFENRSEIVIPKEFDVEEPETDSVEAIAKRRQLLHISLL